MNKLTGTIAIVGVVVMFVINLLAGVGLVVLAIILHAARVGDGEAAS